MVVLHAMTSFSRLWGFLYSRYSSFWWGGFPVWQLWIGRARHPGPGTVSFAVEIFNAGGWLILDAEVDF